MTLPIFVIGIDCATNLRKVGAAFSLIVPGERPTIENLAEVSIPRIASRLEQALSAGHRALLALDSPLGWPAALGPALTVHRAGRRIPIAADLLFRRATDQWVTSVTGQRPLDIGADKIARTAHATLELLNEVRELTGTQLPMAWRSDFSEKAACIEVYPAATLKACGLPTTGYKGKDQAAREQREHIVDNLEPLLDVSTNCRASLVANDHALDAAVCVLAASDFLTGLARPPENEALAHQEGWIWVRSRNDT